MLSCHCEIQISDNHVCGDSGTTHDRFSLLRFPPQKRPRRSRRRAHRHARAERGKRRRNRRRKSTQNRGWGFGRNTKSFLERGVQKTFLDTIGFTRDTKSFLGRYKRPLGRYQKAFWVKQKSFWVDTKKNCWEDCGQTHKVDGKTTTIVHVRQQPLAQPRKPRAKELAL